MGSFNMQVGWREGQVMIAQAKLSCKRFTNGTAPSVARVNKGRAGKAFDCDREVAAKRRLFLTDGGYDA